MARTRRSWGALRELPSGRWQARYPDADTGRLTPADQTFASKTAADRWLNRKRAELDAGIGVDDRAGKQPLADLWPAYVRTWGGLAPSSKASYETAWRLRIEPHFGATRVRRIKPSDIDEWVSAMIEHGHSRSLIVETVGVLKRILDRAVRDKLIPANPCGERSVTLPRKQQVDRPVLSPADVEKIGAACKRERDRVLIRFLAYSGVRIGEAFALRWSSVDLERRTVTIRENVTSNTGPLVLRPTKTYASRSIDIPQRLSRQMRDLRAKTHNGDVTSLVFPDANGNHLRYNNWRKVWNRATREAGIKALPHDLRATCASLLIDAGASVKDVQSHLGHSSVAVTMDIYARVRPHRSEDLARRLDALIGEAG
jgi:integrase